ncbi:hypothetical protein NDU88_002642 [Pleurodeles waltl]|uniref:Uncharacterized protein n=1 Tax=Pleurodeles waltl TaxID=8319 RepID=A0AAV7L432_PLEWA|nr:hypothetical protein NDU88_002642 [Pleurodeles waltl]
MRLEIAGFQSQTSGLDHRVVAVESQVVLQTDRDEELLHLRSKLTDLEDRSRRNNVRFLGFPEGIEGTDILSYLRDTLPKLADITFDPPLEFQRAHRLGLKRQYGKDRLRPIIACFLWHRQVRQLLQMSRRQGPLRLGTLEIHLSADFSKVTADRRRAFLSLRPRLRHLDVKFGLFEPARMWITKNGESRTFYDPEDLKTFLEGLHDPTQPMESATQPPQDTQNQTRGIGQPEIALDTDGRPTTDPQTRGRDLERLTKSFDDRGQEAIQLLMTRGCRKQQDHSAETFKASIIIRTGDDYVKRTSTDISLCTCQEREVLVPVYIGTEAINAIQKRRPNL